MPAVLMYVAPPGYMEWTTDGQQANDLGTKLSDNALLTGRCQKCGQKILAEERNPLESLHRVFSIIRSKIWSWSWQNLKP